MDGLSIKPGATMRGPYSSRDPLPVRQTADTELDPSKAVAATDRDHPQQHGQQGGDPDQRDRRRTSDHPSHPEVVVDPETQDRLFRERDVRAVPADHPDQAMLRQRAYGHTPANGATPGGGHPHADIEA